MSIDELAALVGGIQRLADAAGVHWSTVCGWKRTKRARIPVHRALLISEKLDVPLHLIRPDVWAPFEKIPQSELVSA